MRRFRNGNRRRQVHQLRQNWPRHAFPGGETFPDIDRPFFNQELAALESRRQLLAYGLFNDAVRQNTSALSAQRQCSGRPASQSSPDTPPWWVGQHERCTVIRAPAFSPAPRGSAITIGGISASCIRAPPGGGEADQRAVVFQRLLHRAYKACADDGTHRSPHKGEFKGGGNHRHRVERTFHHHQRVFLARLFLSGRGAVLFFES